LSLVYPDYGFRPRTDVSPNAACFLSWERRRLGGSRVEEVSLRADNPYFQQKLRYQAVGRRDAGGPGTLLHKSLVEHRDELAVINTIVRKLLSEKDPDDVFLGIDDEVRGCGAGPAEFSL
jgi:hypothetical protein